MLDDAQMAPARAHRGGTSTLPDDLHRRLAEAFDGEVAARMPRLQPAMARLRRRGVNTSASTVRTIVSEVHSLASSAVVVGAHDAAWAARACEHRLLAYTGGEALPPVVVTDALMHLDRLVVSLAVWSASAPAGAA